MLGLPSSLPESGLPVFLSQVPLVIYFVVSLQDLPVDVAIVRFVTSYTIPLLLWITLSWSPVMGLLLIVLLWYFLTAAVPYSTVRVPRGTLRRLVRTVVSRKLFQAVLPGSSSSMELSDLDIVNPYAMSIFIKLLTPLVISLNSVATLFGRPPPAKTIVPTSRINFLWSVINSADRAFYDRTGRHLLFRADVHGNLRRAKRATRHNLLRNKDETELATRLFFQGATIETTSATGRLLLNNYIAGNLDSRFTVCEYVSRNPRVRDIAIRKPIIIVGLPRTGSTLLQHLLAADPTSRHLRMWEMNMPLPPPEAATYYSDPRIQQAVAGVESVRIMDGNYLQETAKYHEVRADNIEEELLILHHGMLLLSHYFIPGENSAFYEWFMRTDNKAYAYEYMRMFLQVLSSRYAPKSHWILKAPIHSLFIDALMAEFGDARIVNTHRDPKHVIVSWTKFQVQMLQIYDEENRELALKFARLTRDMVVKMILRVMQYRDSLPPDQEKAQFIDLTLEELSSDPEACVRRIYDHFGLPFSETYAEQLRTVVDVEKNEQVSSHGGHGGQTIDEKLAELGLDAREIETTLKAYYDRFLPRRSAKAAAPALSKA